MATTNECPHCGGQLSFAKEIGKPVMLTGCIECTYHKEESILDTATVLEIIERVENALKNTPCIENFQCDTAEELNAYTQGRHDTLQAILDHLQSFIEGQLNAAENQGGE